MVFSELCNECGNCMTFCPEEGDPALVKPRLYLDQDRFDLAQGVRFLLGNGDGPPVVASEGGEAELETLGALLRSEEGLPLHGT